MTGGHKFWGDGAPVAGQQFDYRFDDIGNRTWTTNAGHAAQYNANLLNQYTNRTVPGFAQMLGSANSNATVTLWADNSAWTPTARKREYFQGEIAVNNTTGAVWLAVTNLAVLRNGNNADLIDSAIVKSFLPVTPEQFSYDADGNLTGDGRWSYSWGAENRLVAVAARTAAGPQISLKFDYDPLGRRIRKQVWSNTAWTGSPTNDVRFAYDGWTLIAVLSPQSSVLQSFGWGLDLTGSLQHAGGVGGLLWVYDSTTLNSQPSTHLAAFDGNGNVAALIDASSGIESARCEYGPFGEISRATGAMANANPFRFSTKYQDDETDLLHYGHRYYNASTGRWNARDPFGEPGFELLRGRLVSLLAGGQNRYHFVGNDPVDRTDRLGLDINVIPTSLTAYCCGGKIYSPSQSCCIGGRLVSRRDTEEVTLTFRKATLPGGSTADMVLGKRHCSVTTSQGATGQGKVGAGVPGQGAEGYAYTLCTEMVDHTGQSAMHGVINVKVRVKRCCFLEAVKKNTTEGPWIPLVNDCNTIMKDAVNGCGGDWDKAYAEYLRQNSQYQNYWEMVEQGYENQWRYGMPWN